MSLSLFEQLVREFGQSVGLPELALDNEARCHLVIDDELLVSLEFQVNEQQLLLSAPIGQTAQSRNYGLLAHLLENNLTAAAMGEPVVGLEPTTSTLLLVQRLPTIELDNLKLQTEMERFIAFVEHWQQEMQSNAWQSDRSPIENTAAKNTGHYLSV